MNETRPPAVAGSFYPADPGLLQQQVDQLLEANQNRVSRAPKAIVAPHAGYQFSGSLAAKSYSALKPFRLNKVVLLGPSHHVAFKGIAAPTCTSYSTPIGGVPIDSAAIKNLVDQGLVGFLDEAHRLEHSLEVHLPFLQRVLSQFQLVPLVVGDASPDQVATVLEPFFSEPNTLVIISSDLSHFHNEQEANQIDQSTSEKILAFDSAIEGTEACGCRPLNGLLQLANRKKLTIKTVGITNSVAGGGDKNRVVGYGAFHFFESNADQLSRPEKQLALSLARSAIEQGFTKPGTVSIDQQLYRGRFQQDGAVFVSLKIDDQLRGCIGSLSAQRSLFLDIANNAQHAAFNDPRFPPLTTNEYPEITIELSVLSTPYSIGELDLESCMTQLRPYEDGIILKQGHQQATYLPSVWDQLPEPRTFLRSLRQKAGLDPDHWQNCQVWKYTTDTFS